VVPTGDRGQPKLSASIFLVGRRPRVVDSMRRIPPSSSASRLTRSSPSPAPAPPGPRRATTRHIWLPSDRPLTAHAWPDFPNNDRRLPPARTSPKTSSVVHPSRARARRRRRNAWESSAEGKKPISQREADSPPFAVDHPMTRRPRRCALRSCGRPAAPEADRLSDRHRLAA
jgi:hypothetical protein